MSIHNPKVQILFVGDMHLGVLPARVPSHLVDSRQLNAHDLGPDAAWTRVVDAAIENQVHGVALAGDLVEGNNALFEAFGLLEKGLRRLEEAGIPVVAVAGNHDTQALPRLAKMIKTLHILGPDGSWSNHMITGEGGLEVQLTGWSFPRPHVETSPLSTPAPSANPDHPTIGLLHADLDQSSSQYAPVSSKELMGTGYLAWFLGHIHLPGEPKTDGRPFYLGSVTGLHPGETGLHGPVLVAIDSHGKMTMQRLPLAPLRWEKLDVPCDGLDTESIDLLPLLLNQLSTLAEELGDELKDVRALGFRLTLTGAVDNPAPLRMALNDVTARPENLVTDRLGTVLFIDKITNETTQRLDLPEIAKAHSPEGLLARQILVLENEESEIPGVDNPTILREQLVARGRQALAEVDGQSSYLVLQDHLDFDDIVQKLIHTGRRALEEILSRKEASHEAG